MGGPWQGDFRVCRFWVLRRTANLVTVPAHPLQASVGRSSQVFREIAHEQISQLDKLVTLAASIYRGPALTHNERSCRRTLLGLLIDTGEDFRRELETDRELYQVIALNAKGIPRSRITARHAANLLAKAATKALEGRRRVRASKAVQIRQARFKTTSLHCHCALTRPRRALPQT